jgi:MSHA biogenesis protein MshN
LQQSQSFAAGNADYQGFAGHVQHRLGQEKASVDFYQSAARLAPADGRWWLGLGLALEADHRPAEAREAFLRARASGSLNSDLAAVVDQKLR